MGILAHNAKTMLLFFVPQIVNFLYSVPQLFKLVPCPRHRMPGYLRDSDRLCVSYAEFDRAELGSAGRLVVWLCRTFRLAKVEAVGGEGRLRMSNLTIINYALWVLGPMHEAALTTTLLLRPW